MNKLLLFACLVCFVAKSSALVCWECEESFGQAECLKKGRAVECEPDQEFCHLSLRHGGWGTTPWVEKTCKTLKSCADNYVQNVRPAWNVDIRGDQQQCNENSPSSVCRCCCSGGLCNQNLTSCLIVGECPPLTAPNKGSISCTDENNLLSVCEVTCRRRFSLQGEPTLTCNAFGEWSAPVPTCERITCHPLKTPEFGSQTCTRGNRLGSVCSFTCQQGYKIEGRQPTTCLMDKDDDKYGLWSRYQPKCVRLQCARQRPLRHGRLRCTDRFFVGSRCTFQCNTDDNYVLLPTAPTPTVTVTCGSDEHWSDRRPCCALQCPPFAVMDFLVILDSSSSVGENNWIRMKDFVVSLIKDFTIRDDSTHVAAFRYNGDVDRSSQILFSDYPNDREGLLDAIRAIPYDGSGTRTGRAIDHAARNVLPRGNRELARDIVLLITDGSSQDRVALPARRLRREGADVYVLPIQVEGPEIDERQIVSIAGSDHPERVLRDALEGGFDALDEAFAARITGLLCNQPCYNPLHNHPDDARLD